MDKFKNFREAYNDYINKGVERHTSILLTQKDREIKQLHDIIKNRDNTIKQLKDARRESCNSCKLRFTYEMDEEMKHLRKTVRSLTDTVARLQRSRDYFKKEYKKLCKALESALQIGGTPVRYIHNLNDQID